MSILNKKIDELELSIRVINALKEANSCHAQDNNYPKIETIADLVKLTKEQLLRLPNFGRKSLNEIKEVLNACNLELGMTFDDIKVHTDMKLINQVRKKDNCYEDLTYNIIKVSEDALIQSFDKIIKKREWGQQDIVEYFNDHQRVLDTYKQSLLQLERILD